MNSDLQEAFDAIVSRQRDARALLDDLDLSIRRLRNRLAAEPPSAASDVAAAVEPPPLPAIILPVPALNLSDNVVPAPEPMEAVSVGNGGTGAPFNSKENAEEESIELRLGSYWLVRFGIIIFLTGLVFLGNFAYHRFVAPLGAPGKLMMLYGVGGTLLAVGAHLDRKRPAMRNYARVLIAGGCAAIYYTSYAAHYVAALRVIENPLIAGALLLALAGGIVWVAERKRSETLALIAVVLGFYTSCINPIGEFTLFSTLLLAGAALVFQLRHGWSRLFWASLIGTYGSYAFWRFHHLIPGGAPSSSSFGSACLAAYWLVFAAALFGTRSARLTDARPAIFFTINNAAFFLLAGFNVAAIRPEGYWLFVTLFGVVLLGLGFAVPERFCAAAPIRPAALAQGLGLTAIGLATKLTGPQTALVFAVESAVLLICAQWRHRWLLHAAAGVAATAATVITVRQLAFHPHLVLPLGLAVSALLLFDATWIKRISHPEEKTRSFGASFFGLLALAMMWAVAWDAPLPEFRPVWFGIAALVLTLLHRPLRLPEIVLPAQAYVFAGAFSSINHPTNAPFSSALFIATALLLEQWWQRAPARSSVVREPRIWQFVVSACAILPAVEWTLEIPGADARLVVPAVAALGAFLYGMIVPAWGTLFTAQLFTVVAAAAFCRGLLEGHPDPAAALAPIGAVLGVGWLWRHSASRIAQVFSTRERLRNVAHGYFGAAGLLAVAWVFEFVPRPWQSPLFALVSVTALVLARLRLRPAWQVLGVVSGGAACLLLWARLEQAVTWVQLGGLVGVASAAHLVVFSGRAHEKGRQEVAGLLLAAVATLWLWVTRWTLLELGPRNLTVTWSLLALAVFVLGFALQARLYRLAGMIFVTLAIARVFLVDVWQFDTLLRIVSFLVLGAVLLVLGFFYNRWTEKLRRWL
jgi:uncharacterized membrane protein